MTSADEHDSGRKRRVDFELNRDLILNAANEAFTELGMGASIDAIAKRAGVGAATIYRHFPSKEALVDAVFDLRIVAYAAAIESAQQQSDPDEAFRRTIQTIVSLQARDRSFREILSARDVDPQTDPGFMRFGSALLGAIAKARETGVLRDEVADADIMLMLISTEGIARPTGIESQVALRRIVDLMLDGVCNHRADPGGRPLDFEQILNVARG